MYPNGVPGPLTVSITSLIESGLDPEYAQCGVFTGHSGILRKASVLQSPAITALFDQL